MATHSSILAWRIPRTEEPGGLQSIGHKESDTEQLHKNTREGCYSFLRGIFLSPGLNLGLLHGRQILYHLSH